MNSLMLLLFGLLCFGSGILGRQTKTTPNQLPGVHHISSGPGKTLTRILPHSVELAHDKHLGVQFISSLPTTKCKNSTKQKQYQQLRTYLRRNLKQLGRGIIVLTNLTKTQSQDVADLTAIMNSRADDNCEEAINTKGISRLIYAVMMAVQNHASNQPPSTPPKAFKNGKIIFPYDERLQNHMEMGLPEGYKRMAFNQGGMPGATPRSEKEGKPITAFDKKPTTYFEFPSMSDDVWALNDPVEKNKTNPMLLIIGQKPLKPKTNKKIYKYYDLPLTEKKARKNADGNFRTLNKRWKMPLQPNATNHCNTFTPEWGQAKVATDKARSRIKNKGFYQNKQSSEELTGENINDESQEDKLRPKYRGVTDESKERYSKETSVERQEPEDSDISGAPKRNSNRRSKYGKRPFKRVDFRKSTTDNEKVKLSIPSQTELEEAKKAETSKEIESSFNDQHDKEFGKHVDVMLKDFPIIDGRDGLADSTYSSEEYDDNDSSLKMPTYEAMLKDFAISDASDGEADSTKVSKDFRTPNHDAEGLIVIGDKFAKVLTYDGLRKDFPTINKANADSTYNSEDSKIPTDDEDGLIDIGDEFPNEPTWDELLNGFPIADKMDENVDSTYDSEDFKTPTHNADNNEFYKRPSKVPSFKKQERGDSDSTQADNMSSDPKKNGKRPFRRVDFIKGPNNNEDDFTISQSFDVKNNKFGKHQHNKPSSVSKYDAMLKDLTISDGKRRTDPTNSSKDFKTPTQNGNLQKADGKTFNDALEQYDGKETSSRMRDHEDSEKAKAYTFSNEPKEKRKRRPKSRKSFDFVKDSDDFEEYSENDQSFGEKKTPSKEATYDTMLEEFPFSDGNERANSRYSSGDFPISDGNRRADSTYSPQDLETPNHNETLQDSNDNQYYEKKSKSSDETERNFNYRQDYKSNQLVDEDDLDYDYGEKNRPSKFPKYDKMLKGYNPTTDFDYSKFDAMHSGENDDYYHGPFDMDMEIDPWIF